MEKIIQQISLVEEVTEVQILASRKVRQIMLQEQETHDGGSSYHLGKPFFYQGVEIAQYIGMYW